MLTPVDSSLVSNEPGLILTYSVAKLSENKCIHVLLVNTTNKTLSFNKGTPMASVKQVDSADINSVGKD